MVLKQIILNKQVRYKILLCGSPFRSEWDKLVYKAEIEQTSFQVKTNIVVRFCLKDRLSFFTRKIHNSVPFIALSAYTCTYKLYSFSFSQFCYTSLTIINVCIYFINIKAVYCLIVVVGFEFNEDFYSSGTGLRLCLIYKSIEKKEDYCLFVQEL